MRMVLLAPLLLAAALPQSTAPAIEAALADPARVDQAGDDARRQAAAVLAFAGVRPGMTVVDYLPGQGYWTRIFAGVVGPKGRLIAMWPAAAARRAEAVLPGLRARGLLNVTYDVQASRTPVVAQPVDLFWTAQNYHDIPEGLRAAFNAAVLAALKPGGVYVVIDHADAKGAIPGIPPRHRIDPAVVRSQVTSVGFRFAGQSPVLANPADDHSRSVFDPAIRGRTNQFVFRFVKPR
jgi:predicted methyltransferase